MSNYIIQTYSRGEDLTNLLSNKIILEIEKETKNHKTNIQVINNGNFIVVRGNTTHKTPINLSKLLISYYKQLFNREINLNVVDLIEYDKLVEDEPIYINKTFIKDELTDIIKKQTYSDTLNNKDYRFTVTATLQEWNGSSWVNALKNDGSPVNQTIVKNFRTGAPVLYGGAMMK